VFSQYSKGRGSSPWGAFQHDSNRWVSSPWGALKNDSVLLPGTRRHGTSSNVYDSLKLNIRKWVYSKWVYSNYTFYNLDFATFEHLEQLYSFGLFRPRDHDRDHKACLAVNFSPYAIHIRWIQTHFRSCFWVFRILLTTENLRSTDKICHTHLLYTHLRSMKARNDF
jgi:hypothetical protein